MEGFAKVVFGNWWLKLLALGMAYALWLAVVQAPPAEVSAALPLELRNLAPGLEVKGTLTTRLHVVLRGPESILRTLPQAELSVVLDLAGYSAGNHLIALQPGDVAVPPGIEVVRITPNEVRLELAPMASGQAPR
jgi:hypothetical protein